MKGGKKCSNSKIKFFFFSFLEKRDVTGWGKGDRLIARGRDGASALSSETDPSLAGRKRGGIKDCINQRLSVWFVVTVVTRVARRRWRRRGGGTRTKPSLPEEGRGDETRVSGRGRGGWICRWRREMTGKNSCQTIWHHPGRVFSSHFAFPAIRIPPFRWHVSNPGIPHKRKIDESFCWEEKNPSPPPLPSLPLPRRDRTILEIFKILLYLFHPILRMPKSLFEK